MSDTRYGTAEEAARDQEVIRLSFEYGGAPCWRCGGTVRYQPMSFPDGYLTYCTECEYLYSEG